MSVENLLKALKVFENDRSQVNEQKVIEAASANLIIPAGYSCVESIMALRQHGYSVMIDASIGYPTPITAGRVIGSDYEIKYGNADGRQPEAVLSGSH